jgi:hypothetical protein
VIKIRPTARAAAVGKPADSMPGNLAGVVVLQVAVPSESRGRMPNRVS